MYGCLEERKNLVLGLFEKIKQKKEFFYSLGPYCPVLNSFIPNQFTHGLVSLIFASERLKVFRHSFEPLFETYVIS